MQRKRVHVVLGILIAVIICLIGGIGASEITAHARAIEISGLGENNAVITDSSGQNIPNGSDLSKWDNYEVFYQWGLPDGESIQSGDTATVTLPPNAVGRKDLSFPLYDDNGQKIGTFSIKEGASTGTITFNDVLSSTATNRGGHLQFYVKGTQENENVGFDWGINKIGWISGHNPDGSPSQLTWNIAFNPNSTHLGETVVTDNLGPGQTYIPGSVHAYTGKYDDSGSFVGDGGQLTPDVDTAGHTVIFTFDDVTTAVNMTYHTKPDVNGTSGLWKNNASLNGQNVGSSIAWGGNGSGNGGPADQEFGKVMLTKTDAATGKALAGAVYELQDATGAVIKSDLITDAERIVTCDGLAAGHYQFVETKAPEGYALDKTPIPFEITADSTNMVTVAAKDTALSGSTTPPTEPENPGTTTPPTTPTEPENPGTTTPVNPENPENPEQPVNPEHPESPEHPGTTTPTHPTTPETPVNPEHPTTTTPTVKPPKPTKPNRPTVSQPGSGTPAGNYPADNAGNGATEPTTGAQDATPATNGAGNAAVSGQPSANTSRPATASQNHNTGSTLPQTGEHKLISHLLTLAGIILLIASLGFWYRERRGGWF